MWPFLLHRGHQRGLNVSRGLQPDPVHCLPGPSPASPRPPEVPLSPLLVCPPLPQVLGPQGHSCPSTPPESAPTARARAGSASRTAGGATTSSSGVRSSVGTTTAASGKVVGRGGARRLPRARGEVPLLPTGSSLGPGRPRPCRGHPHAAPALLCQVSNCCTRSPTTDCSPPRSGFSAPSGSTRGSSARQRCAHSPSTPALAPTPTGYCHRPTMHPPTRPPPLIRTPSHLTCLPVTAPTRPLFCPPACTRPPTRRPTDPSMHSPTCLHPKHLPPVTPPTAAPPAEPPIGVPHLVIHCPLHPLLPTPVPVPTDPLRCYCPSAPSTQHAAMPEPLTDASVWCPTIHSSTLRPTIYTPGHLPDHCPPPPGRQPASPGHYTIFTTTSLAVHLHPPLLVSSSRLSPSRRLPSFLLLPPQAHGPKHTPTHPPRSPHPFPHSRHIPVHPTHTVEWTLRPGPVSLWGTDLERTQHLTSRKSGGQAQDALGRRGRCTQLSWEGPSALN